MLVCTNTKQSRKGSKLTPVFKTFGMSIGPFGKAGRWIFEGDQVNRTLLTPISKRVLNLLRRVSVGNWSPGCSILGEVLARMEWITVASLIMH